MASLAIGNRWLVVGAADLEVRVFAPEPPLHSIVSRVVDLAPLTAKQVGQVLERRDPAGHDSALGHRAGASQRSARNSVTRPDRPTVKRNGG